MHTHLEQWAADTATSGEQSGVRCLAQGSHLSRGQFLPEPRFEPTTSGYKCDALSIRATTAPSCVGSRTGAGSGADYVGSRNVAGSVGSRNGADSVGSRNGADSVGSRNGAGSGADYLGSRNGACSG